MSFLTVFSAPKPFTDPHIATIQRNAIRSWLQLGSEVEVILVGQEPGLAEVAREFGVKHIPEISRNEQGTPLVSSIFTAARQNSQSPLLAYVNADILVLPDLLSSAHAMEKISRNFLLVGQRWDLEVTDGLVFSAGWEARLLELVKTRGRLHHPAGSDYFIYPRGCFQDIPDFAIGRAGWDNWMIFQARRQGWLTVDGTRSVTIVHQTHDYSHLPGGKIHHHLPETDENIRLAGGREITRFSLLDVNRRLFAGRLYRRVWNKQTLRRAIESFPLLAWQNYALTRQLTSLFQRFKNRFNLPERNN